MRLHTTAQMFCHLDAVTVQSLRKIMCIPTVGRLVVIACRLGVRQSGDIAPPYGKGGGMLQFEHYIKGSVWSLRLGWWYAEYFVSWLPFVLGCHWWVKCSDRDERAYCVMCTPSCFLINRWSHLNWFSPGIQPWWYASSTHVKAELMYSLGRSEEAEEVEQTKRED